MRKIIVSIHSTCNDIVSGPAGDLEHFDAWAKPGIEDSAAVLLKLFDNFDTILLGRKTYEGLSQAWPSVKDWAKGDRTILAWGDKMNLTPKLVASSTLKNPRWGEFAAPAIIDGNVEEKVAALKRGQGKDIVTSGSPTLVQALTNAGLVDEYWILVHPVLMDSGKRLFENLSSRQDLQLTDTTKFERGAILMKYEVTRK